MNPLVCIAQLSLGIRIKDKRYRMKLSVRLRDAKRILARLRNDLKNKRLATITGAGVTLNVTADASGKPLSRITWTGLIRNGLEYLISEGYVDISNRRTSRAYEALEDPEVEVGSASVSLNLRHEFIKCQLNP
jgi:hypothetical protein